MLFAHNRLASVDCIVKQQYFTEFLAVFAMPFVLMFVIFGMYVATVRSRVRALRKIESGYKCPAYGRAQRALGLDRKDVHQARCCSSRRNTAGSAALGRDEVEITPRMRMLAVLGSVSGHKARVWESLNVLRTSGTALHEMELCPCIPRSSDDAPPPRYMLCTVGRAQLFLLKFRARVARVVLMILLFLYAPVRWRMSTASCSCLQCTPCICIFFV